MQARQSLSDLLDATIKSMGSTWKTALAAGGVLFAPAAWALGEAYARMFGSLAQITSLTAHGESLDSWLFVRTLLGVYAWSVGAALLLGLVSLFVRACVTLQTWHAANGRAVALGDILLDAARRSLLRLVGQRLLLAAIGGAVMAAAMVPAMVGMIVFTVLDVPALAIALFVAFMAAGLGAMLWLSVRFGLALEAQVIGGLGVDASLDESVRVVRGNWWRVLWRTLLIGLIVGFATSIVTAPVLLFSLLRTYVDFFQSLLAGLADVGDQYANLLESLAGLSGQIALASYLSSVLSAFAVPGFMTLMYLDLRAAHESAAPALAAAEPAAVPAASPESPASRRSRRSPATRATRRRHDPRRVAGRLLGATGKEPPGSRRLPDTHLRQPVLRRDDRGHGRRDHRRDSSG